VESAGLGWVAQCSRLLDVFRSGKDPYKDFATLFFEKPYDEVTRAERNICKPPTLGCFSADTLVFITRGWVPISCIRKADLVFDGVDFVSHDGVVDQGVKAVIDFNGVSVTPDHGILCGDDWCPVLDVSRTTRLEKQAIASANGMFSRTFGWGEEHCTTAAGVPIRPAAEVRTYDILNCGPRNRFMVWTNAGPVIAHNCGYRLSAGRINEGSKTGLLRYAEGMGIDMSEEQAERAVSVFRSGYPEIPQFWYGCEDAIRYTMQTQRPYEFGYLQFDYRKPYLTIRLPSGRLIYYYRPQYVKRKIKIEWEKTSVGWTKVDQPYYIERVVFAYMGRKQGTTQWELVPSHGGVTTENIVQALTRDILKVGLQRLHEAGFKIVGHSHDEAIAVTPIGDNYYTLERMRELMSAPIAWAPGFPLNAAGWFGPYYRK
jgi:hypothetical protein